MNDQTKIVDLIRQVAGQDDLLTVPRCSTHFQDLFVAIAHTPSQHELAGKLFRSTTHSVKGLNQAMDVFSQLQQTMVQNERLSYSQAAQKGSTGCRVRRSIVVQLLVVAQINNFDPSRV